MPWVRSSLSRNPEKKSLVKIFSLQNSCAVRVKFSGKLQLVLKKSYKLVHFDYLLVLKIVVLLTELLYKCMLST